MCGVRGRVPGCEINERRKVDRGFDTRYPQKMIPSIDVTVCTTATNDRDARLLLSSLGIPFYGKHVN